MRKITLVFCLLLASFAFAQPNDDCANAIALSCGTTVATDTSAATLDTDDVISCGPTSAAPNIWFTYTGSGSAEDIELSMCNDGGTTSGDAAYDSKLYVYASADGTCGTLSCIANNDDGPGCASFSSILNFTSDGTTTYYIAVSGYNTNSGTGNLSITCTSAVPPNVANQDCASAIAASVDGMSFGTDNGNGTANVDNPSCDAFGVIQDVWFTFTAPASGLVTVESILDGTATDANIVVYEGTCGSLTEAAGSCQDIAASANSVDITGLVGGNTYYLQAWNGGGAEEGTFSLRLTDTALSVDDIVLEKGFSYYPNPARNELNIMADDAIFSIRVMNMIGQEVIYISPKINDYRVDLSNLNPGMYFVKAVVGDSEGTFRIIKK